MSTPAQRAALYNEWLFAVQMQRWELLKRRYRIARQSHYGQRKAWRELQEFTSQLLRAGT